MADRKPASSFGTVSGDTDRPPAEGNSRGTRHAATGTHGLCDGPLDRHAPADRPRIIAWWQNMNLEAHWALAILVLAALMTRATVRRAFRVTNTLDYERVARSVSMPAPARVAGAFHESSDRANYSPQVWQRICRHEAAHVITLVTRGGTSRSVRLMRDGLAAAGVFGGFDTNLTAQDRAWKHLVWSLAGSVIDDVHDEGSSSDITNAVQHGPTMLSTGRHPEGYQGELTMDQLIIGARAQARLRTSTAMCWK